MGRTFQAFRTTRAMPDGKLIAVFQLKIYQEKGKEPLSHVKYEGEVGPLLNGLNEAFQTIANDGPKDEDAKAALMQQLPPALKPVKE